DRGGERTAPSSSSWSSWCGFAGRHRATILALGLAAACGCRDPIADLDEVYYRGPGRHVVCTVDIDDVAGNDLDSIAGGLDRAAADGTVLQLYAHAPGVTVALSTIDAVLDGARARGLASFTYADLAAGRPAEAGLALSFDDSAVDAWTSIADRLDAAGVRATFFVTRYHLFTDEQRAALHALAARGHDIEAHSVSHLRAPEVAEDRGVAGYVDDDVLPGLALLEADGYHPTVFAYPFGARTPEIDRALLDHFALLRSVSWTVGSPLVVDPCPEP
ncbi:MAG TPA: polysaccharide deacetylase family protein, partial [Kofleriaceae bacterium]|nr:polysaccharide deacetylase family protein [Kofleriaceae bacterium]